MIKVLLIGGGGREHAIARAIKKSENAKLFAAMKNKNPGIAKLCEDFKIIKETEIEKVADYAREKSVDFAICGPEDPLAKGIANELEKHGIACVGPKKEVARIESEKAFARKLMEKYNIPGNLSFAYFDNAEAAIKYARELSMEFAVKPSGLTGGKGVKILGEHFKDKEEAIAYINEIFEKNIGEGKGVVIEERAVGEEFTLQAFSDGKSLLPMPLVQDYKRAYEGDKGHNTGGMGSYSDANFLLPFVEKEDYEKALIIMEKAVKALESETGEKYRGILYGQFMLGKEPKLIEFNCRFGDPEAMNVLSILEHDFIDICYGIIDGRLKKSSFDDIKNYFAEKATVCKYLAPVGYGIGAKGGDEIKVNEEKIKEKGAILYYAAVNEEHGKIFTTSSRSIAVVGVGESIESAEKLCEEALSFVEGDNIYHRRDIGKRELIEKKIERVKKLKLG